MKTLFWIVLIIAILEGHWIYKTSKPENTTLMPTYSFVDLGKDRGLVSAQGSWVSTTKLAIPLSTINIDCWESLGYCWFSTAQLVDNYLSSDTDMKEIAYWGDDLIETKPTKSAAGCIEETYRLDRRARVVIFSRRTVDNTTGLCRGIGDEPITANLGEGFKRS